MKSRALRKAMVFSFRVYLCVCVSPLSSLSSMSLTPKKKNSWVLLVIPSDG